VWPERAAVRWYVDHGVKRPPARGDEVGEVGEVGELIVSALW
jgi:hypothetical protein